MASLGRTEYTVFVVKRMNVRSKSPLVNNVVVELIPVAQCRELGAWIFCNGAQYEAEYHQPSQVGCQDEPGGHPECW